MRASPDRRPIPARHTGWARRIARGLAEAGVTPNQISVFGVLITVVCAVCLVFSADVRGLGRTALLLVAAACIPVRGGCNIFDGMVAVEFGKRTKIGDIVNELPDRLSDVLMLVGAGYAARNLPAADSLGWAAALFAVLTAYVRALGEGAGAGQDFSGVMAKQQRMTVMTLACIISTFEGLWGEYGYVLYVALLVVSAGSLITLAQRTRRILRRLESQ